MTDPTLFKLGPATGGLTERQTAALEHLQAHPEGVRSIDLGVFLHQSLSVPCSCSTAAVTQVACKWASSDGERVGKQLRQRDLAIKRKSGKWQSLVRQPSDPGQLPEGF